MKSFIGLTGRKKYRPGVRPLQSSNRIALAEVKGTRLLSHGMWHCEGMDESCI